MRYFDEALLETSRPHQQWWEELSVNREWFKHVEDKLAEFHGNAAAILPRDAWLEFDNITTRVLRDDGGAGYMNDLMALAKPTNIGKLVHVTRMSSDANNPVVRSMSGQVPNAMDKVTYTYAGAPVPIFSTAYGREWREWNTLQSENFDALADDQEAAVDKLNRDMTQFVLDGDSTIVFENYQAYGILNHPNSKAINLGSAGGGANIDLTSTATTSDDIDNFFTQTFGAMLDTNRITAGVNLYVSLEIFRNLQRSYSGAAGFKGGRLIDYILTNRRINKIEPTEKLSGNEFFGFVPNARFIRPIVGMAVNTTAITRQNPTDNYQFMVMGAMGLEIRADVNGLSGVFYSTDVD